MNILGANIFWFALLWAAVCVLGAAVLVGNNIGPIFLSWWWIIGLLVVGLAPISIMMWLMLVEMTST